MKVLSEERIARSNRQAIAGVATETVELDFDLAANLGVLIRQAWFDVGQISMSAGGSGHCLQTLHRESDPGGLETVSLADATIFNSEIEAWASTQVLRIATDGGVSIISKHMHWDFRQRARGGLVMATNPIYRVDTVDANVTVTDAQVMLEYQYVELTREELGAAFLRSR